MSGYRPWLVGFICTLLLAELLVVSGNYILDPLWCFGHVNRFNSISIVIDQRVQKTDLVAFGPSGYDSLIIGSSRTEPIKAASFKQEKAFNYALPALYPDEYAQYIKYFRGKNRKTLSKIYLGLDFFGTSSRKPVINKSPDYYLSRVKESNFRLNAIFSADPLWKYLKGYWDKDYYYRYNRRLNVLIPRDMSGLEMQRFTEKRLNIFRDKFYSDKEYVYNPGYRKILLDLVADNPEIQFSVFTSTVSAPLFDQLIKQGRYPDYERWLRDIVDVFGSVHNLMTPNAVTLNLGNYYDADHFFPETGDLIVDLLANNDNKRSSQDFGDLVTRESIDSYLMDLRTKLRSRYGESAQLQSNKILH